MRRFWGKRGYRRVLTWKLGMGLAVGSQVERGFSWERKGPLKARVMALRLKAHTADAAMLLLWRETESREETLKAGQGRDGDIPTTANSDVTEHYGLLKAELSVDEDSTA